MAVLERINRTLQEKGEGALAAEDLKQAATTRIAGFEIMPAPYVIAHWQIGHTLRAVGAPLAEGERAAVYLTNALTGWAAPQAQTQARDQQHQGVRHTYPPLADELAEARRVKRERQILVVLGNPPYNAFGGTSPAEESGLVEAYKRGLQSDWGIRKFNLDDLYVRFFRIAERRIAEATGRGVVCFITNHSRLSYPSFVVMRQRLLQEFDRLWLDNLNGSKFETGKVSPDGTSDPSVFSTDANREGIQVGTAIALLVKRRKHDFVKVLYRDLWGPGKRQALLDSLNALDLNSCYITTTPRKENRFSFRPGTVSPQYETWVRASDLAAENLIPGLLEMRRGALMRADRQELIRRMRNYFDPLTKIEKLRESGEGPVNDMARFDSTKARARLLSAEDFREENVRLYYLRPFEKTWCYYTSTRPIWNEPRPELASRVGSRNPCFVTRIHRERPHEGPHMFLTDALPDYHLLRPNCSAAPFFRYDETANLSASIRAWLVVLGLPEPDSNLEVAALPWFHAIALGYSASWLSENEDGIRDDWPRIPLPNNALLLRASAALGTRVAALLEPETSVPGVTSGTIDPALALVAVPSAQGKKNLSDADRVITAGWGHAGKGEAVMPGRGRLVERDYAQDEAATASQAATLGEKTCDVFLNGVGYWRNIPENVWNFSIGGYQVIKKFLSYREHSLLGRSLTPAELRYVRDMARRLAALRLMGPELDANYRACAAAHYPLAPKTNTP